MTASIADPLVNPDSVEQRVSLLLSRMTLAEKIGQMNQRNASDGHAAARHDPALGPEGANINLVYLESRTRGSTTP